MRLTYQRARVYRSAMEAAEPRPDMNPHAPRHAPRGLLDRGQTTCPCMPYR